MKAPFGGSSGNLHVDHRYGLALQLVEWGDLQAAADLLTDTLPLAPLWPPIHFYLGDVCRRLGLSEDSEKHFVNYLALDPEDIMGAGIKLSLMGCYDPQQAMSRTYVTSLFDQYAPHFESSLVQKLDYHTPDIMAAFLPKERYGRVLDLGCGTGLMGAAIKGRFEELNGIDVSARMIAQAKLKGLYNMLMVADIEEHLSATLDMYDLVTAADVFVYAGALEKIFIAVSSHLNPGGQFIMSVQNTDTDGWVLGDDHRYAHSFSYVERCAHGAGMIARGSEKTHIRLDAGKPVAGKIVLCEKP